jgi:hypothetical protein
MRGAEAALYGVRMRRHLFMGTLALLPLAAAAIHCSSNGEGGTCGSADQDGLSGGAVTLDLTVNDDAFSPVILKTQNRAAVTLTLTNAGTRPHDFVVDCLPTPNGNGCPSTSCFPDGGAIGSVPPDCVSPGRSERNV